MNFNDYLVKAALGHHIGFQIAHNISILTKLKDWVKLEIKNVVCLSNCKLICVKVPPLITQNNYDTLLIHRFQ